MTHTATGDHRRRPALAAAFAWHPLPCLLLIAGAAAGQPGRLPPFRARPPPPPPPRQPPPPGQGAPGVEAAGLGPQGSGGKRVLVVSSVGPRRKSGSGVREFIFVMDLQECGYAVDLLNVERVDPGAPLHLEFGWQTETAREVFGSVRWFNDSARLDLEPYDEIFFFGWLWEHRFFWEPQHSLLPRLEALGRRATLMLDDVPTVRCVVEHDTFEKGYCKRAVPELLARWANVSRRVITLTEADARATLEAMQRYGIPAPGPVMAWPLRLRHLTRLRAEEAAGVNKTLDRKYLTMVANDHNVNDDFLAQFFASGVIERLCAGGAVLVFVGAIGDFVNFVRPLFPHVGKDCLYTEGLLSGMALERFVMPKTLAMLNPYFEDLGTGISVKSYEALAAAMPVVTSVHGLRGLEDCGATSAGVVLPPKDADDPDAYARFVEGRVLNATEYPKLVDQVRRLRADCVSMQERVFPPSAFPLLLHGPRDVQAQSQ